MAYIKLNDGSIKSVDDDELKSLITAGAGEETDSPTNIPSLPTSENENGQTTLEPITPNNLDILGTAKQYISGIGGTSQSPQEINQAQYLSRNPQLQGDNTGINQKAKDYNPTIGNFGKAVVDIGSYLIPCALPLTSGGFLSNALIQGLGGGAMNAGSQYMDEGKINPKEVAFNALTSGLLGGVAGKLSSNIENKINRYNGEIESRNRVIDNAKHNLSLIRGGIVPSDIPPIYYNFNRKVNFSGKVDLGIVKKEMASKEYFNEINPEDISNDAAIDYYVGLHNKITNAELNTPKYPTLIDNPYEGINGNSLSQKAINNIGRVILKYPIKAVNAPYSHIPDILNVARIPGNIGTNALTTGLFDKSNSQ